MGASIIAILPSKFISFRERSITKRIIIIREQESKLFFRIFIIFLFHHLEIQPPERLICLRHAHADRIPKPKSLPAGEAFERPGTLIEVVRRAHIAHIDEPFDAVRELDINPVVPDGGDDPVVDLPDFILHIVDDLDIADHILDAFGFSLGRGSMLRDLWQEFRESSELLLVELLMEPRLDDAVDLEVRIPPDRGGKMRIVPEGEPEVPEYLLGVDSLGHALEYLFGEHERVVLLLNDIHNVAEGAGAEHLPREIVSVVVEQSYKRIGLLLAWLLMDAIEERDLLLAEKPRNLLVREDHEFLDDLVRLAPVAF